MPRPEEETRVNGWRITHLGQRLGHGLDLARLNEERNRHVMPPRGHYSITAAPLLYSGQEALRRLDGHLKLAQIRYSRGFGAVRPRNVEMPNPDLYRNSHRPAIVAAMQEIDLHL